MTRWREGAGPSYAARFAALEADGGDVHGEAALCATLVAAGSRVLDAGCGTGRVAARLARLGYHCTGVDLDESMLSQARRTTGVDWVLGDIATARMGEFDLVVAAGNVVPLLASPAAGVANLAEQVARGGWLVAGFGLDAVHLPSEALPVELTSYDDWTGLTLDRRLATWDGVAYDGGGYAVSVHRR